jgi:hypothetical protein
VSSTEGKLDSFSLLSQRLRVLPYEGAKGLVGLFLRQLDETGSVVLRPRTRIFFSTLRGLAAYRYVSVEIRFLVVWLRWPLPLDRDRSLLGIGGLGAHWYPSTYLGRAWSLRTRG